MIKRSMDELDRKSPAAFRAAEKFPVVIVLDNIRSMMNIGSVFRTADAFLIEAIYLCGITATPPNREIHKTALGATESVSWHYYGHTIDAVAMLKQRGYRILALEQTTNSVNLTNYLPLPGISYALVFGNEIKGVEEEVLEQCDACIEIPQFGTKHSLNVAVTAGIMIWDIYSKLSKQGVLLEKK